MVKKIVLFLSLGAFLIGIGLWAGLTWVFGAGAEAALSPSEPATNEEDEDAIELFQMANAGFERGFLSSRGETHIGLTDDEDGDGLPDDSVVLKHEIFHGPLAMTPDGIILCSNYIITTIDFDRFPEEMVEEVRGLFGENEPLIVRTTTGMDRTVNSKIEVAAFASEGTGQEAGEFSYDGFSADITFTATDEGTLESLTGNATLGGWRMQTPDSKVECDPGTAEINYQEERVLKGHITLGDITSTSEAFQGKLSTVELSFDQERASELVPLLLGTTRFGFDELQLTIMGETVSVKNGEVVGESGQENDKLHGSVRYGFGDVEIAPTLAGPMVPFLPAIEKGFSVEIGGRGVEFTAVEAVYQQAQGVQKAQFEQLTESVSSETLEFGNSQEYQVALREYMEAFLGLFQPGAEIYQRTELRGQTDTSHAEIAFGLGGEKSLMEQATLRELLSSLAGKVEVRVSKSDLPPEHLEMMAGGLTASGFLSDTPAAIIGNAQLTDGIFHLNGQPTPMLDMLGPQLDEPIPWDEFMEGAVAGAAAAAEP